jgi:hypothetical protein
MLIYNKIMQNFGYFSLSLSSSLSLSLYRTLGPQTIPEPIPRHSTREEAYVHECFRQFDLSLRRDGFRRNTR